MGSLITVPLLYTMSVVPDSFSWSPVLDFDYSFLVLFISMKASLFCSKFKHITCRYFWTIILHMLALVEGSSGLGSVHGKMKRHHRRRRLLHLPVIQYKSGEIILARQKKKPKPSEVSCVSLSVQNVVEFCLSMKTGYVLLLPIVHAKFLLGLDQ